MKNIKNELSAGMLNSFNKISNNTNTTDLSKAVDYLNSAAELLEELGLYKKSNKIINLLTKIAEKNTTEPSGLDITDVTELVHPHKELYKNQRLPGALHPIDYKAMNFGKKYTPDVIKALEEGKELPSHVTKEPHIRPNPKDLTIKSIKDEEAPKHFNMQSVLHQKNEPEFLSFKSLMDDDLNKAKDKYTKGLTSDKMTKNLKDHSRFNKADDDKIKKLLDEDITFEDE